MSVHPFIFVIGIRNRSADRLEQIAQVVLLDRHLDIDILLIPEVERRIVQVPVATGAYGPLRFILNVVLVYLLQPGCLTRFVGGDDVAS